MKVYFILLLALCIGMNADTLHAQRKTHALSIYEDPLIYAHGDRQGSAADAWKDVGGSDEDTLDDLGQIIHKNSLNRK